MISTILELMMQNFWKLYFMLFTLVLMTCTVAVGKYFEKKKWTQKRRVNILKKTGYA